MAFKYRRYIFVFIVTSLMMLVINNNSTFAKQSDTSETIHHLNEIEGKDFYTDLDGKWHFFAKELLTPDKINEHVLHGKGKIVSLPSSFETQTGEVNAFGTYSTTIEIPKEYVGKTLAIHIPYQYSAYILYIDQVEVAQNGTVGKDPASHSAEMAPKTAYFVPESKEILLTMQVSSFDHIRGGFENSIYLGEASVVTQKFNRKMIGTIFLNGIIFIIGLFMILFAWYRRKEFLFFLFGLFAMLISVRAIFAVPFYYTLIFIDMPWLLGTKLEYILTEATSMFYIILLWKWHEKEFSKKIMYGLVFIHLFLIVTTLITQPVFFQDLFFQVFYITIPTFFYAAYVIAKSIRNNNKNAKINLIGLSLIFLAFFNDFAIGQNWYQSWTLMLPAVAVYVMIHVIVMSKGFADSVWQTEQQNKQLISLNTSNEELALELQKEIKQKDEFLANTSHELRNPLHGIINISQSILQNRSEQVDKKTRSNIQLQLTIGHHMSRTLEDLLDITRLKEHRIHLHKERLDLQAITRGVVDMLSFLMENKNIQMDVQIASDFPSVAADKNRLIQILFNVLHNAVKFTDEGIITIDADIHNGKARVHITDPGIGMDDKTLNTIFQAYKQGDSSMTAIGGGLGLGLYISKQLVEMHGGSIKAHSVLGEGTVFTFTLPLAKDSSFESGKGATPAKHMQIGELSLKETPIVMNHAMVEAFTNNVAVSKRPRILAVDDDPVNLQVLRNILSKDQYIVESVTNGKAALQLLEGQDWDLIISDVMMPTMSGYDLTRAIRKKFSISELPILLLTARSNPEDIYTGFLAGANDYVTKPVDAVELNVRVHALTNLQASVNERLGMEAAWLQSQIRPHFLFNTLNAIVSLSEVDTTRMKHLLDRFTQYLQSSFYLQNLEKVVHLQYEVDLITSYLYIEKERFRDRLQIKWEIEEVGDVMIPPLSIQTLVENAVNHGVLKQSGGGSITIRIHKVEEDTEISVMDDGIGMEKETIEKIFTIQPDRKKGIGLLNTQQRLKQLYGKGLHVRSTPGIGTTVTFTVPNIS
ncbi:ATP-binding protein [Gracilibacillus caseinilyticus]|uniref:histidine kinase n=1 Tax=Gracilibacillus caseinilyticus TaxID=2932256 RepID=A0ABY4F173_9BACI|nr:ATP-binding protein [Gracilibacillus caseinilyticus]UOQ50425.1 ATP-binding protein [Gracilibacillus caseinilyticus]